MFLYGKYCFFFLFFFKWEIDLYWFLYSFVSIDSYGFILFAQSHELCQMKLQMGDFFIEWNCHQGNHPVRLCLGCKSMYGKHSKVFFDSSIIKLNYGTQKANLDQTGSILLWVNSSIIFFLYIESFYSMLLHFTYIALPTILVAFTKAYL